MITFHIARELRAFGRNPVRLTVLTLFALVCAWSVSDGVRWQRQVETVLSETPADMVTQRDEWMADLRRAEAGEEVSPYAARPMSLTFMAQLPPGRLAALAGGGDAIHPHTALINGWLSEASLFRRYEVEGPSALHAGRLDLSFLVIAVLPMLLLMLSFDTLSREREAGRFTLFLLQGGQAWHLILARLIVVALPLWAIISLAVISASLLLGAPFMTAALWIASMSLYLLFWCSLAALVAVFARRTSFAALGAIGAWAVFVVLIPLTARFTAETLHPVPSRVTYLTEARLAEGETRRNLTNRSEIYMAEHPDMANAGDEAVPGYYQASYLANIDINAHTRPLVARFEAQQAAQRQWAQALQFLSPALIVEQGLHGVSGTGPQRAAAFRAQARQHLNHLLEAIGPATVARARLTLAQAEALPEFSFSEPQPALSTHFGFAWMLVLVGFGLGLARRVARRAI
ncbi:DUF3526 domain-containing protein [Woodsholea maritima]|uniref:DUF3526 domain-containing protein n=1 Tax=Woodsholea maritima TaxID=240237 RepID=UPI00036B4225|nr:DUF3526 domain-containing protein [Woodsholea maritima]